MRHRAGGCVATHACSNALSCVLHVCGCLEATGATSTCHGPARCRRRRHAAARRPPLRDRSGHWLHSIVSSKFRLAGREQAPPRGVWTAASSVGERQARRLNRSPDRRISSTDGAPGGCPAAGGLPCGGAELLRRLQGRGIQGAIAILRLQALGLQAVRTGRVAHRNSAPAAFPARRSAPTRPSAHDCAVTPARRS